MSCYVIAWYLPKKKSIELNREIVHWIADVLWGCSRPFPLDPSRNLTSLWKITSFLKPMAYGSKHCLRRYLTPLKSYPKHFLRRHVDPQGKDSKSSCLPSINGPWLPVSPDHRSDRRRSSWRMKRIARLQRPRLVGAMWIWKKHIAMEKHHGKLSTICFFS